jgi:hypothetical protein
MAFDKLICPQCSCPLTASPSQTQVSCSRCGTFLEIDASCTGACISCHSAAKAASNKGSCTTESDVVSVNIERNDRSDSKKHKSKDSRGIKGFLKKIFHV